MKREDIFIAVGEVEERFLKESEDYRGNKSIYVWTSAIAACLAFAFVALALLNSFLNPTLPPPISDPIPTYNGSFMLNAAVYPENISGISASKLVFDGSGAQMPSGSAPLRYFKVDSFVVKAELVEELPDTYTKFGSTSAMKVVKLRTLEVIYGKNVPDEFFYIMFNNTSCKDLSKADTVIISMEQCGMENYVLRNVEENSAEALSLLVFECSTGTDNIIFFKNGICVAKDSPYLTEEQKERMISYNGCTEEYTLSMIKKILADPDGMEEIYYYGVQKEPYAISCNNIDGSKAREVLDYVKPFENGPVVL